MLRTGHKHWVQKMADAPKTKWFTSWFAAISQGIDYIFMSLMVGALWWTASQDNGKVMIVGLTITIARMIIMFVFGCCVATGFKNPLGWFKHLKTKEGWIVMGGGIIGGGLGTVFSNLAVIFAGENLGGILTALFPMIVALISRKLFKENIRKWGWVGLGVSVIAMVIISVLRYMATQEDGGDTTGIILGLVFGLLSSITWAAESILVELGTRDSKVEIENYESITMVGFGSTIILLILLPFWTKLSAHNWTYGFDQMGRIFSNGDVFLWVLASATIFFLSWWAYYHAIDKMGSTDATSICVTYTIWTPIFAALIYIPSFVNKEPLVDASTWIEDATMKAKYLAEVASTKYTFMSMIGWEPFAFAPIVCAGVIVLLRNVENGIETHPIKAPIFLSRWVKKDIKDSWDD